MQALSISDDSIELKFDAIKRLNNLIDTNIQMQKKKKKSWNQKNAKSQSSNYCW